MRSGKAKLIMWRVMLPSVMSTSRLPLLKLCAAAIFSRSPSDFVVTRIDYSILCVDFTYELWQPAFARGRLITFASAASMPQPRAGRRMFSFQGRRGTFCGRRGFNERRHAKGDHFPFLSRTHAFTNPSGTSIRRAVSSGVIPLAKKRRQTVFMLSPTSMICPSGS